MTEGVDKVVVVGVMEGDNRRKQKAVVGRNRKRWAWRRKWWWAWQEVKVGVDKEVVWT